MLTSYFRSSALLAAFAAASILPSPTWAESDTPARQQTVVPDYFNVPDFFNDDVSDADRAALKPVHGGELTIRMQGDLADLNPLNYTSAQEAWIIAWSNDGNLVSKDPETYEYVPWLGDWWEVQDAIAMVDGTEKIGLIDELEGTLLEPTRVTFREGAAQVTVGLHDVDRAASDFSAGKIVTNDGRVIEGELKERKYTVTITTPGGDAEEIDLDAVELLEEASDSGEGTRARRALNKHCRYLVHLREGPTWQDGEPIKPEDFTLTFKTLKNEFVDCQRQRNYYNDLSSLKHLGDRVLEFRLNRPYSLSFSRVVTGLQALPSHLIDYGAYEGDEQAYGEYFNGFAMFKPAERPMVGAGAYRVVRWTSTYVELERYRDYWATTAGLPYWPEGAPYLDRIIYKKISSNTAAVNQLKDGEVGVDFDVEPSVWFQEDTQSEEFTKDIARVRIVTPLFVYVGWNMKNELFQDKDVRRALSMLIPRDRILGDIHHGMGRQITGPYFIDGPIYDHSIEQDPYDPKQARRILRRAGWSDRDGDGVLDKDGKKFEFSYLIHNARAYHQKVAEIVKEEFGKSGILVTIDSMEFALMAQRVQDQKFDAVRFAWSLSGFDDPDNFQIYHSSQARSGGSNSVSFKNAEADALLEAIRLEFDYDKRVEMNRKLHRLLAEEGPYAYLYAFDETFFHSKRYRNVRFFTMPPGYDLRTWHLDPTELAE